MALQSDLDFVASLAPQDFDRFASLIDPQWIDEALQQTGTVSLRRRRLPAERMVWLVIGLALFRDESIAQIVMQLDLAGGPKLAAPVPSTSVAGRERLGSAPMKWLFEQIAEKWGSVTLPEEALFHGLRSYAVDGVVWSVPDTPKNSEEFGRPSGTGGDGAWPQVRATCLMDTYTHLIRAANFEGCHKGELTLAEPLTTAVPDNSITIFDRGFMSAAFLWNWQKTGHEKHWLIRAKSNLRYEILAQNLPGDYWVRMETSWQTRKTHPELPSRWEARLIECTVGGKSRRFLTSLCDAKRYPMFDIVAHFMQRWEIELGFREIKQSMLKKAPTLRSKLPELVRQEIWGTLIAYTLMRHEIAGMAHDLHVPPQRLSFQFLSLVIATALYRWPLAVPGTFPKRLVWLREQAHIYLLPDRRKRTYPRVLKARKSKYETRRAFHAN